MARTPLAGNEHGSEYLATARNPVGVWLVGIRDAALRNAARARQGALTLLDRLRQGISGRGRKP